jgi:hypothetical protein
MKSRREAYIRYAAPTSMKSDGGYAKFWCN